MNWIKKCPAFFLLAASGLVLTFIGFAGRFSVYKDYEFDIVKRPYLSLVMEGAAKGAMPWKAAGAVGLGDDEFPGWVIALLKKDGKEGQSIGYADGEEALEALGGAKSSSGMEKAPGATADDAAADGSGKAQTSGVRAEESGLQGSEDLSGSDAASGKEEGWEEASGREGMKNREEADGHGTPDQPETADDGLSYEFKAVTEDYFNDAAFIGDSRTVGLFEYGGIEERADFYAKISLTIYNVFTEQLAKEEGTGRKITLEEALSQKQYGKIYLMLGINELGTGTTETFMEEYRAVVDRIRQLQPDAVIFVEGIMKVTGDKDREDPIFNNTNIEEKNAAIARLADNRTVFYIDVNEAVCDEAGNLNAEYTIDEVHLKAKYYEIWKQFLLAHGIER